MEDCGKFTTAILPHCILLPWNTYCWCIDFPGSGEKVDLTRCCSGGCWLGYVSFLFFYFPILWINFIAKILQPAELSSSGLYASLFIYLSRHRSRNANQFLVESIWKWENPNHANDNDNKCALSPISSSNHSKQRNQCSSCRWPYPKSKYNIFFSKYIDTN